TKSRPSHQPLHLKLESKQCAKQYLAKPDIRRPSAYMMMIQQGCSKKSYKTQSGSEQEIQHYPVFPNLQFAGKIDCSFTICFEALKSDRPAMEPAAAFGDADELGIGLLQDLVETRKRVDKARVKVMKQGDLVPVARGSLRGRVLCPGKARGMRHEGAFPDLLHDQRSVWSAR
ncbi:MAG: hypothetical protein JJT81_07470, partial [Rubellimicrobium sp.]|nr:hypothetical protein [Rubellimicrobium sp.]